MFKFVKLDEQIAQPCFLIFYQVIAKNPPSEVA